ncbi:MAG: UDP-N-acetylmuramoyl-L-alanyl-D-glutamate--2,6-diaminopimelate ligase [Rhodospirillales bacterium]|nr:UDP-N-acetylmuramoyl-L-alanyl-D-glutamate--2,6-diaminopimelate ligase [Rhodospirillales bacterium]MBO6787222.1 UDP-N-acetylmuramoyl-L-alanyl-D-glutamate--2,6-diaminopimelate ligase [Rhodospirillales bacterium]
MDDALSRIEITGVTCDSRRVEPGFVFAALPGSKTDGSKFVADAVARGASAIIAPSDGIEIGDIDIPVVRERDPRHRYAVLCAGFYGVQPAHTAAVTGTNGKTSVAWFGRQLLNAAGLPAASAGTLGMLGTAADGSVLAEVPGALTTPDPADLHRDLKSLSAAGIDHLVIEASSHGLDQRRLDGVRVSACAFTNLSRDHLDYHGTEDAYLTAKLRLFDTLAVDGGQAVVNMDARFAEAFAGAARCRALEVITVGSGDGCRFRIIDVVPTPAGLDLGAEIDGAWYNLQVPLIGAFQASNAMVALGVAAALGVDPRSCIESLQNLCAAPGRMQFCGAHSSGAGVYVDYAHTPDALETVLKAARPHAEGRVHVVFGCGGDRDAGKRPEMGRAAAAYADVVIVTDDNPRSEDAAEIRKQALAGAPDAVEIGGRHDAIRAAVDGLAAGDVLVIAGKGHEQGQIVGDEVLPFDDVTEARRALGLTGAEESS